MPHSTGSLANTIPPCPMGNFKQYHKPKGKRGPWLDLAIINLKMKLRGIQRLIAREQGCGKEVVAAAVAMTMFNKRQDSMSDEVSTDFDMDSDMESRSNGHSSDADEDQAEGRISDPESDDGTQLLNAASKHRSAYNLTRNRRCRPVYHARFFQPFQLQLHEEGSWQIQYALGPHIHVPSCLLMYPLPSRIPDAAQLGLFSKPAPARPSARSPAEHLFFPLWSLRNNKGLPAFGPVLSEDSPNYAELVETVNELRQGIETWEATQAAGVGKSSHKLS
ncbi:uncharacterized protein MYCFIDRAFT_180747 [Pseudocercospora fijiensis CIRAD86]|uniref:Uncharacterized protein n=1 Tax=Pseudocercospora fijiensis (strain CIRAD86) TaxID=383855 RepID=M2ZXG3_PSEFD|nr:uncharacterized protein MYCFIDRAFT_180747 [Pseudocercospora fijiensis CIRAD86]EME76761.1 hypothetical protein MYCFIDRAFT_180747 [Pseudocercospora fijiensis CIRAD86]